MRADSAALVGRISQWLLDLERLVIRAEALLDKAEGSGDDGYLDGVALNLHGFYAGVERLFEDIARTVEKTMPQGAEWHRDLPMQMSSKVNGIRPEVIRSETRYCLDEFRGFRHVVRNVYAFNLRPAHLKELTTQLRKCYEALRRDLDGFIDFLESLSRDPGQEA